LREYSPSYTSKVSELSKAVRARAEDSISQLPAALADFKNVFYANSLGSIGCAPCTRTVREYGLHPRGQVGFAK
jgi:hypothetical protein